MRPEINLKDLFQVAADDVTFHDLHVIDIIEQAAAWWMRVNLTRNGDTGLILDWAFNDSGGAILTGAGSDPGDAPAVAKAGSDQTLSASQAGSGLLMEAGSKITFNEGWATVFSGGFQYADNGQSVAPASSGSFAVSGNTLTWSAVPEPSNLLAGMLAASALLRRRRMA